MRVIDDKNHPWTDNQRVLSFYHAHHQNKRSDRFARVSHVQMG
jgi:hypothetical protein